MASSKTDRWSFRVAAESDQLVRQAAAESQRNLSDFVLQAAVVEAERVLADRTRFTLGPRAWEEFRGFLDRPAQANPRLADLFEQPSVFE
ncbi:MAG TPA: DUF1778 domain-containing protein [Solirubrobacteraceae bacterium]|nr:DUF1778 domain-containing protein [Solirubrobacteraceae bacterium]